MVDIVTQFQEDIIKKCEKAGIPTAVVDILLELHENNRMLQRAVNDILKDQVKLVEAMQLSQHMMREYKSRLNAFERKYSDQYADIINSEKLDG